MAETPAGGKQHTVTFLPMGLKVVVDEAKYPYGAHGVPGSILDIALANGIAIEHACGGVGACGTCHVIIKQGMNNLSEASDEELDRVELAPGNTVDSRLGCQAVVRGDVTVLVPEWNRNAVKEGGQGG